MSEQYGNMNYANLNGRTKMSIGKKQLWRQIAELEAELDEARAKAALCDEIVADASDCLVGEVLGIRHESTDYEPDRMFYFLRITEDEAYHIDMGGYAHLEIWED